MTFSGIFVLTSVQKHFFQPLKFYYFAYFHLFTQFILFSLFFFLKNKAGEPNVSLTPRGIV